MKRLRKTIGLLLICILLFSGCKPAKIEKKYEMADITGNRILYTVELEENKDAERYTSTVTTREGLVYYVPLIGYYYTSDEIKWDAPDYYYTKDRIYCQMWGGVIPFTETDGTVNEYILYSLYDNDLASYFAFYCDHNSGVQTTITWHYDARGYRVIDVYDTEIAKEDHLWFWTMQNQKFGVVPPIQEYDMGLSGKLPVYANDDQSAECSRIVKELYPDVKPYGVDYPVSE